VSAPDCAFGDPTPSIGVDADEIGKTPIDLVSFSGVAPQITAKSRETAFVSQREHLFVMVMVWR